MDLISAGLVPIFILKLRCVTRPIPTELRSSGFLSGGPEAEGICKCGTAGGVGLKPRGWDPGEAHESNEDESGSGGDRESAEMFLSWMEEEGHKFVRSGKDIWWYRPEFPRYG